MLMVKTMELAWVLLIICSKIPSLSRTKLLKTGKFKAKSTKDLHFWHQMLIMHQFASIKTVQIAQLTRRTSLKIPKMTLE